MGRIIFCCERDWRPNICQAGHPRFLHPNKRAGRNSRVRINAKTASIVMPTSRNGRDRSQTKGNRISASSAKGQQSTNKMHQPMNKIRTFMMSLPFHFRAVRWPSSPVAAGLWAAVEPWLPARRKILSHSPRPLRFSGSPPFRRMFRAARCRPLRQARTPAATTFQTGAKPGAQRDAASPD